MNKKILLLFSAMLLLSGCRMIVLKMYGIKNPEVENEKRILKKALKFNLDTTNIVTINSTDFLGVFKAVDGIPNAQIFDATGKYIEYRQSDTACNAGLFQFIPDLALNKTYNLSGKTDLASEFKKYRDLKGNSLAPLPQADFYVFIFWTVWTGKLNKDHVKIWEDLCKQNIHCKICAIKVNLDFQEYWNKSDRDKIIGALGKKK